MVYSESVMEAIKFKLHNSGNNTTIAREIKNEFNLPMEVEILRRTISRIRERYKIKPNTRIKRLFFDIETGYYTCRLWHIGKVGYVSPDTIISDKPIICISYKWQDEDVVHNLDWSMGEKEMLLEFSKVLDEASEVIGHNCVEKTTPVLKSDLTWCNAGDLKEGDELIAFDEGSTPNSTFRNAKKEWAGSGYRKIKKAIVTGNAIEKKECIKITFDNGDSVITTLDHFWLANTYKDNYQKWIATKDLKIGYRVTKYLNAWEVDKSYEAGWLSGFISGEGTLKRSRSKTNINHSCIQGMDFCQRPTSTLEQALDYCKKLDIEMSDCYNKIGGLSKKQDVLYTYSKGGKWKALEYVGKLQIKRFIEKINPDELGTLRGAFSGNTDNNLGIRTITNIENVGLQEVAVLSTSTKTFFADGYPMHNCDRFDIREIRTKCLYYGIPIPPEIRSLDTLKKSREYFNFASNKLDYIGKYLNLGKKLPHEGFQLWVDVVENKKPEALQKMIAYCITPDHKLLKDDFRWYKAEDLKVGDKVLGFDEHSTIHNRRKFKESIIERIEYDIAPVYEVKLSSGKIFKVTEEHQWLVKKGNDYMWKQTNQLSTNEKYPTRISKVLDMWEEDNSKEAGWLAGMFDGEGCLSYRGSVHKDGIKALTNLSISQRPTPTLKKLEYLLTSFSELYGKRTTKKESDCITLHLYGNKYKKLKFLGTIRPERLLDKLKFNFLGSFEARAGDETVVSVTPMGEQKIIKIQTSTGTFICDGYAHHNCNQDVILLEDVYHALAPYITHNNNFGTLVGGDKHYCPECASNDVILDKTYTTATGTIKRRMRCNKCGKYYVVSNKTYVDFLQETLK